MDSLECFRFYQKVKQISLMVLLSAFLFCSISCSSDGSGGDTSDGNAPIPGDSGIIKVSNVTHKCMTFHITEATDAVTTQSLLTYQVEIDDIDSLVGVTINDEPAENFSSNNDTFEVCGLTPDTTYSLDILVRNDAGNRSSYVTFSEKTHPLGVFLLSDINKEENAEYHADTLYIAEINNTVYFNATNGARHGEELWKYDGTNSPEMVADLNMGSGSSYPSYFFTANDKLYFKANDGTGDGLWVYDGVNSPKMISSVTTVYILDGVENPYFTKVNDTVFFHGHDEMLAHELFSFMPAEVINNENPKTITAIDNPDFNPNQIVKIGDFIYFQGNKTSPEIENIGVELFSYNTTMDMLNNIDILPGDESSNPNYLTVVDGKLYFKAQTDTDGSTDLWQYDPTNGTRVIRNDQLPANFGKYLSQLFELNDKLYFVASEHSSENHEELWYFDPAEPTSDINPKKIELPTGEYASPENLAVVDDFIYFSGRDSTGQIELWRYDSSADTIPDLVANLNGSYNSRPSAIKSLNSILYFSAEDYNYGRELWRYNPAEPTSDTNPQMIEIFDGSRGSSPSNLVVQSGKLYFWADDDSHGVELWVTDGEDPNMIGDINQTPYTNGSVYKPETVVLNDTLYFGQESNIEELWRYNYPAINAAPEMMGEIISNERVTSLSNLTIQNDTLFFSGTFADEDEGEIGLWHLLESGEPESVWDYNAYESSDFDSSSLFSFEDNLYIRIKLEDTSELWHYNTTDPTTEPQMVNVFVTAGLTDFYGFTVFNNEIYFGGTDSLR